MQDLCSEKNLTQIQFHGAKAQQLRVAGAVVVTAHDRDIARGQYGIATYRAAANWDSFAVMQP
jgi:hypothetical protein